MELLIVALIAFMVGYRISTWIHVAAFKKILEELKVTEQDMRKLGLRAAQELGVTPPPEMLQEDELEVIHIKLESHQGQIYAFRADNDGFLGQGTDRDSLIQHLKSRMTGVRLVIDEGADLIKSQ